MHASWIFSANDVIANTGVTLAGCKMARFGYRLCGGHHFHIWSLDGEHSVMTVHLVLNAEITVTQMKNLKNQLQKELETFEFVHTTIELEFADEVCRDESTNGECGV